MTFSGTSGFFLIDNEIRNSSGVCRQATTLYYTQIYRELHRIFKHKE